jgi:dihydrofolate reductase
VISLIVAASANNVIGVNGGLPWHLSDDLRRFKAITMGKPIVMGRKTYESIGRPLPGRQNIVITGQADFAASGCDVVPSAAAAVAAAGAASEIMVIGGGQIYALFLPLAQRVYLTRVEVELEGDVQFPALDPSLWRETSRQQHPAGDGNDYAVQYLTYARSA